MRRLVAGDRRVWLVGAAVLAVSALAVLVYLLKDEERYTGTNSVGVRSVVTDVQSGQQLCVSDFDVPEGTGRVQVSIGWIGERRPALDAVLRAGQAVRRARCRAPRYRGRAHRAGSTSPRRSCTCAATLRQDDSA